MPIERRPSHVSQNVDMLHFFKLGNFSWVPLNFGYLCGAIHFSRDHDKKFLDHD